MNSVDSGLTTYYSWSAFDGIKDKSMILCSNNDFNNYFNVEEKLKVDRKKFESLLEGKDSDIGNADTFFGQIMAEFPSVVINWPPKLKMGTKSKKDPHVKITGIPSMVKRARIRILDILDPRKDRVTLKMDVDWTAHSNIIGKSGSSIQNVMNGTECHVHFPDANRTNATEKSNQVSIAGSAQGVSQARMAIRNLLPIIISFNLILRSGTRTTFMDRLNHTIQMVEELTKTQITIRFSSPTSLTSDFTNIIAFIRGVYDNSNLIKIGTNLLRDLMKDFLINEEIVYEMNTEICVQHHSFVMGSDKCNLNSIMRSTGALITFPEAIRSGSSPKAVHFSRLTVSNSSDILQPRKTTVNIKASNVDAILLAFQSIQDFLPLSLTFDLKEGQEVKPTFIESLSKKYRLEVTLKQKPRQNTKTVWIKGCELKESKLFEVRRLLIEESERKTKSMASIWSTNDFDCVMNFMDKLDINGQNDGEDAIEFNRAPGAERTFKIKAF